MIPFLKRGHSLERFWQIKGMSFSGRRSQSLVLECETPSEEKILERCQGSRTPGPVPEAPPMGSVFDRGNDRGHRSRLGKDGPSEIEQMKEKFAKLLLGEDMSGSGKGVSSALALSNAITNLAASVFGEQRRLEPMQDKRKARWKREINWLLSVTDHIVEFVPTQQVSKDGTTMEVMRNQQRKDLHMNIPALRTLDTTLLKYLDGFKDHCEFWYVSRDADESKMGASTPREDDKWWLPSVKVPLNGLSEVSCRWLQDQKDLVNQVLKAAMEINANILMEMEIPEAYIESLPKNGRSSLGDALYKSITDDVFNPEEFLSSIDLSSEHKILDLKNKIEASIVIWRRKMNNKDVKSPWGSAVSLEKREQFEERAETILLILKQQFPGIPQSSLDINKIQYNKDVGYAILESYSRVVESLAFTVMSRIEDVLFADSLARDPSLGDKKRRPSTDSSEPILVKALDPKEEMEKLNKMETTALTTLSDFMGWNGTKEKPDPGSLEAMLNHDEKMAVKKPPSPAVPHKRFLYIENLNVLRSPTSRLG
ncbi:hypothetical protein LUZ60_001108 [Juncus effusus]|nr:hypothetical protein LUZ60_001108 [Juncus effusus]